ncbi:MAG: radical SAM protein [Pirellulales bacterium]|nr:radical SAM protein [Pirellulales bacterium]
MLFRLAWRLFTEISPRLAIKAGWLWVYKGMGAVRAYRRRLLRGEVFPPFLFLALTNACNLRCHGCWIESRGEKHSLDSEDVDRVIAAGKRQGSYFYTLLGGEPMIYEGLWELIARHPDCYFQIITNGMFHDEGNVERIRKLGNVTPLVSIDGMAASNDDRRGPDVFEAAVAGMRRLKQRKILFGVATTMTSRNMEEVLSDEYVRFIIEQGAMYLWFYVFRPVGADPSPHYCVGREQMIELRRRLLELRRRHPIMLIDTYWNARGEAVCPAALGMGYHIGPRGSIEACPPLSFACETIHAEAEKGSGTFCRNGPDGASHKRCLTPFPPNDNDNLFDTINQSEFLRGFSKFVNERTRGCVILEHPQELVEFLKASGVKDYSGRDALAELAAGTPRGSHDMKGEEIPEDYWVYRFLKNQLFFGMSGYG